MELYTLDRGFKRNVVIDSFESAIWTERYYGDGEVELVVPMTSSMIQALPPGVFLGLKGSKEVMMVDTIEIEKGALKVTGPSIMMFLNNRFIRATAKHEDRYWTLPALVPGQILTYIVQNMCIDSGYLNGTIPIGVPSPQRLKLPGLSIKDYDRVGPAIVVAVPYGPVYDALREIATTYQVGMQVTLESVTDTSYSLQFRSYRGVDRTSGQSVYPVVRFSPQIDTLTDIKELQSIAAYKTLALAYAPGNPNNLATTPGQSSVTGTYTGFDLRALMVFCEDLTTDNVGSSAATLLNILNARAHDGLTSNPFLKAVDGEVVPNNQFLYGRDYNLGDIIEVRGNTGVVQKSRITEYIRAEDDAGERAYPTVAAMD